MSQLVELSTAGGTVLLNYRNTLSSNNHPPIVFIHGRSCSLELFTPLSLELSQKLGNAIIMYDLENHGLSGECHTDESEVNHVDHHVDSLEAFLEYFRVGEDRPCTLVAHAEGAFIATSFASRNPLWVANLILLCPALPPLSDQDLGRIRLYETLASERSPEELAKSLARLSVAGDGDQAECLRDRVLAMMTSSLPPSNAGFHGICNMMKISPPPDYYPLMNVRSVVVFGTHDGYTSRESMHALAANLKGKAIAHLKDDFHTLWHFGKTALQEKRWERETMIVEMDGGFWLPLEKPEVLADVIERFVNS